MYYNVLSLNTKPGKRLASFGYLREVAEWMTDQQGVLSMGFTNMTGQIYQLHLFSLYESLAHYDQFSNSYLQDEWFNNWFARAGEAVKWETLVSHLVRVFRRSELTVDTKLMAVYSMNLVPGRRYPGVDHLIKFAEHMEGTYNLPSEVTADEAGNGYRHHLALLFDSMDGYDRFTPSLREDEWYHKWFREAFDYADPATMNVWLARRL